MTSMTLTGTLKNADGSPAVGQVELTPTQEMRDASASLVVPWSTVRVALDNVGHFSVQLYANDDAATQPPNTKYAMVQKLIDGTAVTDSPLYFVLPHVSAPSVDLSALTLSDTP
jgi:hypothetical protein